MVSSVVFRHACTFGSCLEGVGTWGAPEGFLTRKNMSTRIVHVDLLSERDSSGS